MWKGKNVFFELLVFFSGGIDVKTFSLLSFYMDLSMNSDAQKIAITSSPWTATPQE